MTAGGRTPEELETLLEDALLMRDAEALTPLFEDASVLVAGQRPQLLRGPGEIARAARLLWAHPRGYLAGPRRVFQARDTALLLGDGVINVARRGADGSWRYAISVLHDGHAETHMLTPQVTPMSTTRSASLSTSTSATSATTTPMASCPPSPTTSSTTSPGSPGGPQRGNAAVRAFLQPPAC